ncbi:MAG: preprotein translocase subunit SecG [Actinobacteria bacterium]|nr:MAG: preprotein translocase subunit SecG [Actinomycetota bacterium]
MSPLTIALVILHCLAAVALIVFILLHSGKGTGVSSMFGAMQSAISGTSIIEKNLDRITIVSAVVFFVTAIILMMTYSVTGGA